MLGETKKTSPGIKERPVMLDELAPVLSAVRWSPGELKREGPSSDCGEEVALGEFPASRLLASRRAGYRWAPPQRSLTLLKISDGASQGIEEHRKRYRTALREPEQ